MSLLFFFLFFGKFAALKISKMLTFFGKICLQSAPQMKKMLLMATESCMLKSPPLPPQIVLTLN